jgi:predicted RNase H-like nuclease (RuvC/YqgF family)
MKDRWNDKTVLMPVGRPRAHAHLVGPDGRTECPTQEPVEARNRDRRQICAQCKRARLDREQKAGALARTVEDEQRRTQDLRAALDRIDRLKVEVEIRDERINKLQRQTQIVAASDMLAKKRAAAKAPEPVAATEPVVVAGDGVAALVDRLRAERNEAQRVALARGNEKRAAIRDAEREMRAIEQRLGKRIEELERDCASQSRSITAIRRALGANSGLAEARGVVDKILGAAMLETVGGAR